MTVLTADDLVDGLRAAGFRITRARREICRVLASHPGGHLSAADMVDGLGGVDQSTVYRTLETLEAAGLVHHVHLGHGAGVYHVAERSEAHHHLVCEMCGRVVDIPLDRVRAAVDEAAANHGFVVDTAHFALVGRCIGCTDGGPSGA